MRSRTMSLMAKLHKRNPAREIKYFHPTGGSMPNGHPIQRGGFIHECQVNMDAYELDETVHPKQYAPAGCRGGIITFSTDVVGPLNDFSDKCIGSFSVGSFFKGYYVGDNGKVYDERSVSVEVNGLSSKSLFELAELLCKEFSQKTVLVKNFNTNKMYLVDFDEPSA